MLENMKRTLQYRKEQITFLALAKIIVSAVSLLNLVSIPTYSDALLLLENELCGAMLFGFMLFGLVALFGAIRLDPNKLGRVVFMCLAIVVSLLFAVLLINTLTYAFYYQASLTDHVTVANAINFGIGISVGYGVGLVVAPVAYWLDKRKNKKIT